MRQKDFTEQHIEEKKMSSEDPEEEVVFVFFPSVSCLWLQVYFWHTADVRSADLCEWRGVPSASSSEADKSWTNTAAGGGQPWRRAGPDLPSPRTTRAARWTKNKQRTSMPPDELVMLLYFMMRCRFCWCLSALPHKTKTHFFTFVFDKENQ